MSLGLIGLGTFVGGGIFVSIFGFKWIVYLALLLLVCEAYKRGSATEEVIKGTAN